MTEAGYARSTGTPRGEARRVQLLDAVVDDLVEHGVADFSLRRAARAAGTTHKVLLYHFDGVDDLLLQAVIALRRRRIDRGLAVGIGGDTLAERVRSVWPVLTSGESAVLDQVIGLAIHDPARYGVLAREASTEYLPALIALCPRGWADGRKREVAAMVLATLRGFLVDLRTSGDTAGIEAGFTALTRALDREETSSGH